MLPFITSTLFLFVSTFFSFGLSTLGLIPAILTLCLVYSSIHFSPHAVLLLLPALSWGLGTYLGFAQLVHVFPNAGFIFVVCMLPSYRFKSRWTRNYRPWGFALGFTGAQVWFKWTFPRVGMWFEPGMAAVSEVASWKDLWQIVAWLGVPALTFFLAFAGATLFFIIEYYVIDLGNTGGRFSLRPFLSVTMSVLVLGGARRLMDENRFPSPSSFVDFDASGFQVACAVGAGLPLAKAMSESQLILQRTNTDVLIWTEDFALVSSTLEEMELHSAVSTLSNFTKTTILAAYRSIPDNSSYAVLFSPANPLAPQVARLKKCTRPPQSKLTDTDIDCSGALPTFSLYPFGYQTTAMFSFDATLPTYAIPGNADLVLLSGLDQGAAGFYQSDLARARAVHGGFTMVRCVSGGLSSVVDPFGKQLLRHVTGAPLSHWNTFVRKPQKRLAPAVDACFGVIFEYLCGAVSVFLLIWAITPEKVRDWFIERLPKCKKCKIV